ncbi:type VI secretion system ATPase TssH [Tateyamaria omphalii]|uniref:type VI secretion system ATPase TssH n=1 Tax=Tateyamaria omphalii TaxID=299262 RepID=UPI001C98F1CF|nr:type VI secretion system ATPase TssH [Tateyamaria omphalii]MBY5931941.1 type VI secretion system ATPase TssH [Tateyamaria omphalii]
MPDIDLHVLISRLTPDMSSALEAAAGIAVRNGHGTVEPEHWIAGMCGAAAPAAAMEAAGVNPVQVRAEAMRAIEALPRGAAATPTMAASVVDLARESWTATSLRFAQRMMSADIVLFVLASDTSLRAHLRRAAPALLKLDTAVLEERIAAAGDQHGADLAPVPAGAGGEDFLALYAHNLTEEARAGRIDRIVGRDAELRQMIDILLRRRQNNPILLGEAGVGKTAVVEAFALMIANGSAPGPIKDVTLYTIDLNLLQAGAGVKGEFERRLTGVLNQVKAAPGPVILFIDEAHGLIGAGGQAGQGDAANILKPALARGELRTIAATTWGEYKKHFEKDAALTRRFQPVKVNEPDIETAIRMLRAVAGKFEEHHGVSIRESALRAAVELSARYLPERQLPDKAVSVIDTAAAAVRLSRDITPEALDRHRIEAAHLTAEIARLEAEPPNAAGSAVELKALRAELVSEERAAESVAARLDEQRALARAADAVASSEATDLQELAQAEQALAKAGGEAPLVHRVVDAEAVAQVIGRWTGVPTGRLMRSQIDAVATLDARLNARVMGQEAAIGALCRAMRVSRAQLGDTRRPKGVFLLAGMSGVGKTETALALADELYGGQQALSVINMSEFKEEHKVSLLMGSPPGYVGYGEGGVLTEAVRRRPYGVLLLDEIDKAHPSVQDIFYQVFDKGVLRDGEGRDVDFKNTTILMTANTGTDLLSNLAEDPETMPAPEALPDLIRPELLAHFKPAFLGRLTVVPYQPLDTKALEGIVDLQLARVQDRLMANYDAKLQTTDAARDALGARAKASETGARAIEAMISQQVLPQLADLFLDSITRGLMPRVVELDVDPSGDITVAAVGKRRRLAS